MTTDELKALLAETTPGPWLSTEMNNSFCIHPDSVRAGYQARLADVIYWSDGHTGDKRNPLHGAAKANARPIAMAPALAAEVIALREREARLVEALREAREAAHSVAHSEYDGVWNETDFSNFTPLADAVLAEIEKEAGGAP